MDQTSTEKVEIKFRVTSKLTNQKPWSEKWAVKMGDGEEFVVTEEILKLPDSATPPKVICIFSLFNGRLNYEQHDSGRITTLNGAVVSSQVVSEGASVEVGEGTKIEIVKAPALGAPSAQTHDGPSVVAGPAAGSTLGGDGPDIAFDEEAMAQEQKLAQTAASSLPDPDRDLQLSEGDSIGLEMDGPMIADATQSQAAMKGADPRSTSDGDSSDNVAPGEILEPMESNDAVTPPAQGTKGTVLGKLRGILKGGKSEEKKSLRPEPIAVPREHMTHSFTSAEESSGLKTGNHAYAKKLEKAEKTISDLKRNENLLHRIKSQLITSPQVPQNAKTAAAIFGARNSCVDLFKVVNRKNTTAPTASVSADAGASGGEEAMALKIHAYDPGISIQEIDRRIPIIDALASRSPVSEGGRISTIRNQMGERPQSPSRSNIRTNPNMRPGPRRR